MRVYRVRDNGEHYFPAETRDGRYQLADPRHGSEQHKAKYAVFANTLEEAVAMVRERGFSLWMKGEKSKQRNLIAPQNIRIE